MSDKNLQGYENHARWDPAYHIVLALVLVVNLVLSLIYLAGHWSTSGLWAVWFVVLSIAAFIPYAKLRTYPLKVQDRIIRLEERLRIQTLAPTEWHAQLNGLSEDQLIALRFAADDEVVELAKHALEGNLNRKQIKQRIKNWRADNWRV